MSVGPLEQERDEARAALADLRDRLSAALACRSTDAAIMDAVTALDGSRVDAVVRGMDTAADRAELELELESIDGALGIDEHDTRHAGDRVERIEALHEQLLVAEQDRDRLAGRLADAKALDENAVHDLGRGTLDAPVIKATRIALDGLGEVCTDPCARALLDVVRALVCG